LSTDCLWRNLYPSVPQVAIRKGGEMQEQQLTPRTNGNRPNGAHEAKQRRRMWLAILLLLTAVVVIVVKDWHVWFPPAETYTEAELGEAAHPTSDAPSKPVPSPTAPTEPKKHAKPATHAKAEKNTLIPAAEASVPKPPVAAAKPAVVPPLALEIVTGDAFRKMYPGNDGLRVEIQSGSKGFPKNLERAALGSAPLSPAAERSPISADITRVPVESGAPPYPTLAQKMKVQGSVVLQAVIGSDGLIEDLRILSGPALLASAAREAVRQWHFKPYLQNGQPVETLAKITVNFIISTT
jgi:periplasmic protein TonB